MTRRLSSALAIGMLFTTVSTAHSEPVELCDVKEIALAIEAAVPPKSQFESESDFRERAQNQFSGSGFKANEIVCLMTNTSMPPMAFMGLTFSHLYYDAESQAIRYKSDSFTSFSGKSDETFIGEYEAQNAYGAKTTVRESERTSYGISMSWPTKIDISIPMTAAEAESQWAKLAIAVRFNISQPHLSYEFNISEPEIDNPVKEHRTLKSVKGVPTHILLVRTDDGSVIWEESVTDSH